MYKFQKNSIKDMKKVYTAAKHSYGTGFFKIFDTLDELKRAIVEQEVRNIFNLRGIKYTDDMYTEARFKKHSENYVLYRICLYEDEKIVFNEYDGQSDFTIQKKDPKILSSCVKIDKKYNAFWDNFNIDLYFKKLMITKSI